MMEQGPVLVVSFTSQEISVVHDSTGRVVEGDPVGVSNQFTYLLISMPTNFQLKKIKSLKVRVGVRVVQCGARVGIAGRMDGCILCRHWAFCILCQLLLLFCSGVVL